MGKTKAGEIGWTDLTVKDAKKVRDFYREVVGWTSEGLDMGGYEDYCMNANGKTVAGICHKRGCNAKLPSQWLVYITVKNLKKSVARCRALGGRVVAGPRGGMCVIRDPAGAVAALYQEKKS